MKKHLTTYNKVGNRHYALSSENNFEMYARKVALLQVLKYMPASIELANAVDVTNAAESGKHAILEGDFVRVHEEDPPVGDDTGAGTTTTDAGAPVADGPP